MVYCVYVCVCSDSGNRIVCGDTCEAVDRERERWDERLEMRECVPPSPKTWSY